MTANLNDRGKENCTSIHYCLFLFSDGILPFVDKQFSALHAQIARGLPNATACTGQGGSCSKKERDIRNWCYSCGAWRTSILGHHKHKTLFTNSFVWSKIDSSQWPKNVAEVKKVFFPDWYFKPGAICDERDTSVLLNCMYNCRKFTQLNVATVRKMRNHISHTSTLSDDEVRKYCHKLCTFLADREICRFTEATTAAAKIAIFADHTLSEIKEQALIDEIILLNLERRLFTYQSWLVKTSIIVATVVVFVAMWFGSLSFWDKESQDIYQGFRLDIETYAKDYPHFTGREWLFKEIKSTLQQDESRGIILIADPGYGKTAAISKFLYTTHEHAISNFNIIHHPCSEDSGLLRSADTFILNIVYHLYQLYPDFKTYLASKGKDLSTKSAELLYRCNRDAMYCARTLLIDPLQKMKNQDKKLLLIVDSLDRCFKAKPPISYTKPSIVDIIFLMQSETPNWIRFLLTTRNDSEIIRRLTNLKRRPLKISDEEHKKDFLSCAKKVFANLSPAQLKYLEYDFLKMDIVLKLHSKTLITEEGKLNMSQIPQTIEEVFEREMTFLYGNCDSAEFKEARSILEIISATFEPLSKSEIYDYVNFGYVFDKYYNFNEIMNKISPHLLVETDTGKIRFRHMIFKHWLTDSARQGFKCYVHMENGHRRISMKMMHDLALLQSEDFDTSRVDYLIAHMNKVLSEELISKFKTLPSFIVDKKTCFVNFMNRTACYSVLDTIVHKINSYRLTDTLLTISKSTNHTEAALHAIYSNNTETLRSILEHGKVDVASCFGMVDLTQAVKYVEKDCFPIIYFAVVSSNLEAIKLIMKYNSSSALMKTRDGFSVIQHAVFKDDVDILKLFVPTVPFDEYILQLAVYLNSFRVLTYMLERGLKDKCVKCTKNEVVFKSENVVFFPRLNATVDLVKDVPSLENPLFWFFDSTFATAMIELTCESALHFAVKMRNTKAVEDILNRDSSTISCQDFQGLPPLGTLVAHPLNIRSKANIASDFVKIALDLDDIVTEYDLERDKGDPKMMLNGLLTGPYADLTTKPFISRLLIKNDDHLNFKCKPDRSKRRAKAMQRLKVYDFVYTDEKQGYNEDFCSSGSSIGHLLVRNPSCTVVSELIRKGNIFDVLSSLNEKGESPLYWLLCKGNNYINSKGIAMLLFLLGSHSSDYNRKTAIDILNYTICNIRFKYEPVKIYPTKISTLCENYSNFPPNINDIFLKMNSKIYKNINIFRIFQTEDVVKVMVNMPNKMTMHILSIRTVKMKQPRGLYETDLMV